MTEKALFRDRRAELCTFALFILLSAVISYFHEPAFDEAQAWQIARTASVGDIFTAIGHYEGHFPLWYLIQLPFARLGAPYALTIKLLNLSFSYIAVWLLIFRSPFPKPVRCLMPFTFYIFYQTAAISRPYSLVMLGMFLCACTYRRRAEKPLGYFLSLALLCASHAYGLILAGGLCLVLAGETLNDSIKGKGIKGFLTDKRTFGLCFMLVFALLHIISVIPADNIWYGGMNDTIWDKLKNFPLLFIFAIDSLFGSYIEVDTFKQTLSGKITTAIGGAILLIIIIMIMKKNRKLALFSVPFFLLTGFGLLKYMSWNHLAVITFFYIFCAWVLFSEDEKPRLPDLFIKAKEKISSPVLLKALKILPVTAGILTVVWSGMSAFNEIMLPYGPDSESVEFLRSIPEGSTVMVNWEHSYDLSKTDSSGSPVRSAESRINNTFKTDGTEFMPYLEKNIFVNYNAASPEDGYMHYYTASDKENEENFALWRQYGYPDYMLGKCPLDSVFPELEYSDISEMYEEVFPFQENLIYKLSNDTTYKAFYRLKDEYKGKGKPQ